MSSRSDAEETAVSAVLETEWPDGTSTKDVAKCCIKALDQLRSTTWRPIGPPLTAGTAFTSIFLSKTQYVIWTGMSAGAEYAWVVTADSDYGTLIPVHSPGWQWTTPVKLGKGIYRNVHAQDPFTGELLYRDEEQEVPLKIRKFYPPVHKALFEHPNMVVGERINMRQSREYTVEAVFSRGVLLRERESQLVWAEENSNLSKYYTDGWR